MTHSRKLLRGRAAIKMITTGLRSVTRQNRQTCRRKEDVCVGG